MPGERRVRVATMLLPRGADGQQYVAHHFLISKEADAIHARRMSPLETYAPSTQDPAKLVLGFSEFRRLAFFAGLAELAKEFLSLAHEFFALSSQLI